MSSYFDDASLVMIPSGYKTSKVYSVKPLDGSGDLTFTRSNDTATRVNSAGLIEKVRTNLVTYSNDFSNAAWTKTNFSLTSGQSDPFGGSNAWKAECTSTSGGILQTVAGSGIRVVSVYAKAGNVSTFSLWRGSVVAAGVSFNLANGTIISGVGTITSVGGGWYRCSTFGDTADVNPYFNTPTSGDFIYIAFSQLENGDVATDYIATTSAAVSVGPVANVPRLDYLNSTCPRLLLEPQRTNLLQYSEQFDNAYWQKDAGASVTANAATSPDGYANADRLSFISSGLAVYRAGLGLSGAHRFSVYLKGDGGNIGKEIHLEIAGGTSINVTLTGSWQRFTAIADNASSVAIKRLNSGQADSVLAWGAQLEAGAYATSYIPTLGAAVTRGADAASKTGISSLIGQTEGTLFAEVDLRNLDTSADQLIAQLFQDSNNRLGLAMYRSGSTNRLQFYQLFGGNVEVNINTLASAGVFKLAGAYKNNDYVFYVNGVQIGVDTTASVPTASSITLGTGNSGVAPLGNAVKELILFKTRLSNADLAALTA